MAQEIVFYHSSMAGAASGTLTAAGTLLAVLDQCLVDGFNSITVSTLTQTGGTATATTASSHNFSIGDWIEIAGADQAGYNGRVKVLTKPASNQFTYAVSAGTTSPATGTITAKHPGAGWLKSSLGTNIRSYQGGSGSLGLYMQIEDNNPYADGNLSIRTRTAQTLTALDTAAVIGIQNKVLKLTGGWIVVADKKSCYIFFGGITGTGGLYSFAFGEVASFYPGDQFSIFQSSGENCFNQTCYNEANVTQGTAPWGGRCFPYIRFLGGDLAAGFDRGSAQFLRGVSQIGGPVAASVNALEGGWRSATTGNVWTPLTQDMIVPSLADNSIPVSPMFLYEYASTLYTTRGKLRGMYWPLGAMTSGFVNSFQKFDNALIDGVSQPLLLINSSLMPSSASGGAKQIAFQTEGSWG